MINCPFNLSCQTGLGSGVEFLFPWKEQLCMASSDRFKLYTVSEICS